MIQKISFFLFLIFCPSILVAQTGIQTRFIEGKILEKSTYQPVPYAKVINQTTKNAVLADENGYFKIAIQSLVDSVCIDVITYQTKWIDLKSGLTAFEIFLEENVKVLSEVNVVPKNNSYLYELLQDCRKNQPRGNEKSKMYYELKSFVDSQQVELVESFYNGNISGYDLEALDLKTGRFALRAFDHTFFGSMQSSKAITMISLFEKNDYFPQSPFELSAKKQKQLYYLRLPSRYLDAQNDSVYVIEFIPRDKSGNFFNGRVFVHPQKKNIIQVELHCEHAQNHPFKPIFPNDTIQDLDLHITKSFAEIHGKMCFQHVDFTYQTTYKNRSGATYKTLTKAILYAYDFDSLFTLPKFDFHEINDYRKINAIPYNAFFWKNHKELKLSDHQNQNELFYNDTASATNRTIFSNGKFEKGFLESPYITWSGKRIRFREFSNDTAERSAVNAAIISELYNLSVKIYMDINLFSDTVQVLTSTIFDPYESYYKLPLDRPALYFINVYFDLVELERRELETAISRSDRKMATVEKLYAESQVKTEAMQLKYIREVEHGKNEKAMEKWNKIVFEALKINNLELFQPYE